MTIYSGQTVSNSFLQRWRSANHVGGSKPRLKVEYRIGEFVRKYHTGNEWTHTAISNNPQQNSLFGEVAGGNGRYWYPDWTPHSSWTEIGEVYSYQYDQDFQKNGIATATIVMDNTILNPATGLAGMFHQIQEGWWTPLRGYKAPGQQAPKQSRNANFQALPNAQIRVWCGYGDDTMTVCFLGLIDTLDIEGGGSGGQGEQVTMTCRDFGGVLQDSHLYIYNVDPLMQDPVTFVPRQLAEKTKWVSGGALGSSHSSGHPARFVSDASSNSAWESAEYGTPNPTPTEWIEITLPEGEYNSVYCTPEFDNQELYVSIKATVRHTKIRGKDALVPPRWVDDMGQLNALTIDASNTTHTTYVTDPYSGLQFAQGWVDLWHGTQMVPGADNVAFHRVVKGSDGGKGLNMHFGGSYQLGHNSKIRIYVRKLGKVRNHPPRYRAGILRMQGAQRHVVKSASKPHWIIVDDVSEMVETVLRFAGFKSWEVQSTGVDLKTSRVYGKGSTYLDVINDVKSQTGFTFFVAEPKQNNNDLDIGTAVFRQSRVLDTRQQSYVESINDDKLLTGSRINYNNNDQRYVIRCRGQMLSRAQGGQYLNGDPNSRAHYTYYPPWVHRMAGVIKQFTHYNPDYLSNTDCQFAAYLIAMQISLSAVTAVISTAGTPHIGLDSFLRISDRSSGTSSRVYVSNRQMQFQGGEQVKFVSQFGGALVDTPDLANIVAAYQAASKKADRNDGPAKTNPPKRREKHKHTKAGGG